MAYLGAGLDAVNETLSTINMVCDTMTGNGVLTTKVLGSPTAPGSVNNVSVYYDGVAQTPTTDYTLSGSTITFTTAPASNVNVVILSYADEFSKTISDNTVYTDVIEDSAITNNKILGISASKLTGALPALDGSALTGIVTLDPVLINETSNPTVSSMLATGNGVGTIWVNSTTGAMFICTDATVGANVWLNVGGGSGNVVPYMTATNTNGIETTDGDYKVVTFNTSGTFTPVIGAAGLGDFVEYLVIAGGAGGGANTGGGGGAGGYLTATNFTVTSSAFTVTVGGGGAGEQDGAINTGAPGANGTNSVFSSITSTGGGGGGSYSAVTTNGEGQLGGSGGGGGAAENTNNNVGGAGTVNQGFAGGAGAGNTGGSRYQSGGGGGASAVGANAVYNVSGGDGGAGLSSSISGSAVIRAGGGGGAGYIAGPVPVGAAGAGGGGIGGIGGSTSGAAGTVNTGGGAGGGEFGGAGGSGVVIIRYRFQ